MAEPTLGMARIALGQGAELARAGGAAPAEAPGKGFAAALERALDEANATNAHADATSEAFVRGEDVAVHDVMVALAKADVATRLVGTVTTRAIAAYNEIARMQV